MKNPILTLFKICIVGIIVIPLAFSCFNSNVPEDTTDPAEKNCFEPKVKPDYVIELYLDSAFIQSDEKVYRVHYSEIQEVIEIDNL